jgi:hypothetical protein
LTLDAVYAPAQEVGGEFYSVLDGQVVVAGDVSGKGLKAAMVVSLDGAPIKTSRRVLVQSATQSRPTGWSERPVTIELKGQPPAAGFEITSFGAAPWQVASAQLEVTIDNPQLTSATVLDMNGMPVRTVPLQRTDKGVGFSFPTGAMYVVLR